MANELRVGEINTALDIALVKPDGSPYDLTGWNLVQLKFQCWGASAVTKNTSTTPAVSVVSAVGGTIRYIFGSGDLSAAGPLRAQVLVEKGSPATERKYSQLLELPVLANL